jgi:site-specific recombinase XerD
MNTATLDPWVEGYLDYQRTVRRLTPRSIIDIRCTLRRVVRTMAELRPGIALWQLSLEDFLQWVNRQREQDYSVQSINKDLSHVRGLLEYAWRSGHAQRNVLDGFSLQDSVRKEVPKFLNLEQARRLMEACPTAPVCSDAIASRSCCCTAADCGRWNCVN